MASFEAVRNELLLAYDEEVIDDEEFLLLWDCNKSKNPDFSYEDNANFDLDCIAEAECKAEFRVEKNDLEDLAEVLQIPETFVCSQRSVCSGIEGLCIALKRLAYPCRCSDMIYRFAKPVPVLSMITNTVIDYIYDTHGHRITEWNDMLLDPVMLEEYANVINIEGSPLENCFGFIDGTVRPICRPGIHQRVVYNGHKRVHALKFQSVALPSGIIANMYGPVGKLTSFKKGFVDYRF